MFFIGLSVANAQNQLQIQGNVSDTQGDPIIGATVVVKNTPNGTITDAQGNFSITAALRSTIVVSFVGYNSKEVFIQNNDPIKIILDENLKILDEIVVVGYGQQKKGDITGSLTTIKPDELNKGLQTTVADALVGKVAGVNIVPGNGAPGSSPTIRIRMGSSLSASNSPLIVIDGIPTSNSSPLSSINPNDIESFTVLKDASATSIYGSRASNGVIIITTKKGSQTASKPKFNISTNTTISQNPKLYNVLSADEYRSVFFDKANPPIGFELGGANTNWQNEIYQVALGNEIYLAVTGNTKNVPYRISTGYTNQNGVLKTNKYQRFNTDFFLSPEFFNKHLKIDVNVKAIYENDNPASTGAINTATFFDPTRPINETYTDNVGLGYFMWFNGNNPISLAPSNPIADLMLTKRLSVDKRLIGNIGAEYKLHGLEDLKLKVSYGFDLRDNRYDESIPDFAPSMYTSNRNDGRGREYWSESKNSNTLFNSYINYNKEFLSKHSVNAMAGYEWQRFWYSNNSETIVRDVVDNSLPDKNHLYLVSLFGRFNYSYDNKLLLTASLRADATSRFASHNKWGYFPSLAAAYRLSEENFIKESSLISDLKIRLSYGQTGQQAIGGYHPYLGTYTISTDDARYLFGDKWHNMYRPNGYDPNIKWETTTTYNLGVDYGFYNHRINGTIDIFKRYTSDLLNVIPFPAGSNFINSLATNIGNMESEGFEIGINLIPIKTKSIEWQVSGNFTYSKSTITKLNTIDREDSWVNTGTITRRSFQIHKVGETPNTFFLLKQAYDDNGKPLEGQYIAKDGTITTVQSDANKYVTGKSSLTPYYYGISTKLIYKNFDFGLNGHGSFGNYVFNHQEAKQSLNSLVSAERVSSNISKTALERGFLQEQYFTDLFLENGAFFKLDNITAGYTIDKIGSKNNTLRIAVSAQNLLTLTKYSGVDPEIFSGIDNSIYQRPYMYTMSVNYKF